MLKFIARVSLAYALALSPVLAASNPEGPAPATQGLQQSLNAAIGACTEAAWTGAGTPTVCSVLKGMFGQALVYGALGSPSSQVLSVQGAGAGATPVPTSPASNPPTAAPQTGTLTAAGQTIIISLNGMHAVGLQISGLGSNTINVLGSQDNGATYPVQVTAHPRKPLSLTVPPAVTITNNGNYDLTEGSLDHIELQAAAGWSGAATVTVIQTDAYSILGVTNSPLGPLTVQLSVGNVPVSSAATGLPVVTSAPINTFKLTSSAAGTNATNFATGAKRISSIRVCSSVTTPRFVKVFDKGTSAPVPGNDTPKFTIPLPAAGCAFTDSYSLTNGLGIAITAGSSDTDATAVSSGDVYGLNIDTN